MAIARRFVWHFGELVDARSCAPMQFGQERRACIERRKILHSNVPRPLRAQNRRMTFEFFFE
jgi:hypothetical protein